MQLHRRFARAAINIALQHYPAHGHHHGPHDPSSAPPYSSSASPDASLARAIGHSAITRIFFRASFALFLPSMSYIFLPSKRARAASPCNSSSSGCSSPKLLRKKVYAMVAPHFGPPSHAASPAIAPSTQ
ncbi:hypothetical protein ZWY2020_049763 [Hordeum vulgare]|nr:hypothetical protein ZWY2020_049763 [Hordeum vulgare]